MLASGLMAPLGHHIVMHSGFCHVELGSGGPYLGNKHSPCVPASHLAPAPHSPPPPLPPLASPLLDFNQEIFLASLIISSGSHSATAAPADLPECRTAAVLSQIYCASNS